MGNYVMNIILDTLNRFNSTKIAIPVNILTIEYWYIKKVGYYSSKYFLVSAIGRCCYSTNYEPIPPGHIDINCKSIYAGDEQMVVDIIYQKTKINPKLWRIEYAK